MTHWITFAAELHEVCEILETFGNHHEGTHGGWRHRIYKKVVNSSKKYLILNFYFFLRFLFCKFF